MARRTLPAELDALTKLTTIKLALQLLPRRGPLSERQEAAVRAALGAVDSLAARVLRGRGVPRRMMPRPRGREAPRG